MARKKPQTRAKRGSVSVTARSSMLRLRWRYLGEEYQIALGLRDTPYHRTIAQKKASEIELDMGSGHFDITLAKYKPEQRQPEPERLSTVEIYQAYTDYQRDKGLAGYTLVTRNKSMQARLTQFGKTIESEQVAQDFINWLRKYQTPQTVNENLSKLKSFGAWAVKQGHWQTNHFEGCERQRVPKTVSPKRLPLSSHELDLILQTFKTHKHYYVYHDFVLFLFYTGVRPSEAIGLRWMDVDFTGKRVVIKGSLSRGDDGRSSSAGRKRKATKNKKIREIDLHDTLFTMLKGRFSPDFNPEDLVFMTVTGKRIDDKSFARRAWDSVLEAAQIQPRNPYVCRHSLASFLLEKGWSIAQVAKLLGNRPETVARYYANVISNPAIPDLTARKLHVK